MRGGHRRQALGMTPGIGEQKMRGGSRGWLRTAEGVAIVGCGGNDLGEDFAQWSETA